MTDVSKRGRAGAIPKPVRRIVTKLTPALYTRLYAVKLRTGKSLQALVTEAVLMLIAKYRVERDANREPSAGETERQTS